MATCPACGAAVTPGTVVCPDCETAVGAPDEVARASLVTVFVLRALQSLAAPAEAVADADGWSDHVRVVTDGPQFVLAAFKQTHDVSQGFEPRWVNERTLALTDIAAETDADRYLLVGSVPADEALATDHGWDYRAIDEAARLAGWTLAESPTTSGAPGGLVSVAVAIDAATGVAEEVATALADVLTARRGLNGPRAEPFVVREYLTAVADARSALAELEVICHELASLVDDADAPEPLTDITDGLLDALRSLVSRGRSFLDAAAVTVELGSERVPLSAALEHGVPADGEVELVVEASGLDQAGRALAAQLDRVDARADEVALELQSELKGARSRDENASELG